ncbi:hypothetical protein MTR_3g052420 [Medicago truncatula]|uniref:Uncharacterized protein n=1 Tax=Medicago truncatula TaxID=3880 RepID=G7IY31_MEDTR|nr:hypothetical protein MTR_3g052420 [Medicago truncatula]
MGDLLMETQTLASSQNSKKSRYLSINEGYDMFNEYQSMIFHIAVYWSCNSGQKAKEEALDLSKFMNDDMSTM